MAIMDVWKDFNACRAQAGKESDPFIRELERGRCDGIFITGVVDTVANFEKDSAPGNSSPASMVGLLMLQAQHVATLERLSDARKASR